MNEQISFRVCDWIRTSTSLGYHPLKMACLPISPRRPICNKQILCDLAGIRTQDPYIKSVLLYQLSYQVYNMNEQISFRVCDWIRTSTSLGYHPLKMACLPISPRRPICNKQILCDLAGIRTQDPYIKSVLLYQLSYQVFINYTLLIIF